MSELISGKEALIALANGEEVEYMDTSNTFKSLGWGNAFGLETNLFFSDRFKFRLKPRTVNLNGVDVGQLYSSQWDRETPYKVVIEFKTEEEAVHFNNNALKIFNGV